MKNGGLEKGTAENELNSLLRREKGRLVLIHEG